MAQGTIVPGQLLRLIPAELFDKLATHHQVNKGARKMTATAHFAVMLFAQLAGLPSLRKLETATSALTPAQRKSGLIHARRSTLAGVRFWGRCEYGQDRGTRSGARSLVRTG